MSKQTTTKIEETYDGEGNLLGKTKIVETVDYEYDNIGSHGACAGGAHCCDCTDPTEEPTEKPEPTTVQDKLLAELAIIDALDREAGELVKKYREHQKIILELADQDEDVPSDLSHIACRILGI